MDEPLAEPCHVRVEDGIVLVDGTGVALALTPRVAQDLSEQLHAAVVIALAHRAVKPIAP